jgi:hypothetical protein
MVRGELGKEVLQGMEEVHLYCVMIFFAAERTCLQQVMAALWWRQAVTSWVTELWKLEDSSLPR